MGEFRALVAACSGVAGDLGHVHVGVGRGGGRGEGGHGGGGRAPHPRPGVARVQQVGGGGARGGGAVHGSVTWVPSLVMARLL